MSYKDNKVSHTSKAGVKFFVTLRKVKESCRNQSIPLCKKCHTFERLIFFKPSRF